MATFSYDKQTVGKTTNMFEYPLTATVAIGELISSAGAVADASSTSVEFIAHEGGDSGDSVLVSPVISGVTILEGVVDADGGVSAGDSVGIDASQNIDANASNDLFIALEDGDAGDSIRVLVTAGL